MELQPPQAPTKKRRGSELDVTMEDCFPSFFGTSMVAKNLMATLQLMKERVAKSLNPALNKLWRTVAKWMMEYGESFCDLSVTDGETNQEGLLQYVIPAFTYGGDYSMLSDNDGFCMTLYPYHEMDQLMLLFRDSYRELVTNEDKGSPSYPVISTTSFGDTSTFSTTVPGLRERAAAHFFPASNTGLELDELFGCAICPPTRSALSQLISVKSQGRFVTSRSQVSRGNLLVDMRVSTYADAAKQPEDAQWKSVTKKLCFVTRGDQDPLEQQTVQLISDGIARVKQGTNFASMPGKMQ